MGAVCRWFTRSFSQTAPALNVLAMAVAALVGGICLADTYWPETAGYCLAATASRDGLNLAAVVMGSETSRERFDGAEALLDYGFSHYCRVEPGELPRPLGPVPVTHGAARQVEVTCVLPDTVLIREDQRDLVTLEAALDGSVQAPVEEGTQLGTVTVLVDGTPQGEYPVRAAASVPRMTFLRALWAVWQAVSFVG